MESTSSTYPTRTQTKVNCSRCKAEATVPFVPTPGRPVYCRACFEKRPAPSPRRGPRSRGPNASSEPNVQPRVRMLSYRRKGHFVYDALEQLEENAKMDEEQRRTFVEMLFTRGARQSSEAALDFLDEKRQEQMVGDDEADALARIVKHYSQKR